MRFLLLIEYEYTFVIFWEAMKELSHTWSQKGKQYDNRFCIVDKYFTFIIGKTKFRCNL